MPGDWQVGRSTVAAEENAKHAVQRGALLCCLNYSNLVGQLELPGRAEKDEEDSEEENRTGRIHLSGWRGELPRQQKNKSCWVQGDGKQTFCKRLTLSETALENLKLLF